MVRTTYIFKNVIGTLADMTRTARLQVISFAGIAAMGMGLVVGPAVPVFAATPLGICTTNQNPGGCLREDDYGYYTMTWNRAINKDARQNWWVLGKGTVNATWPFKDTRINERYLGNPVFEFQSYNDGQCLNVGSYKNQAELGYCNAYGTNFVWAGNGGLINVYQTDYWDSPQYLMGNGIGNENYTLGTANFTRWQEVNPY